MVRWLLDTNLVIRSSDPKSALHQKAIDVLDNLFQRGDELHLAAQNLIEFWAVATRPISANGLGWGCEETDTWIEHLSNRFLFLDDSSRIFGEWRNLVRNTGIQGKRVHDARLVAVMRINEISHLLTFNTSDFKAFPSIRAMHPDDVLEGKA